MQINHIHKWISRFLEEKNWTNTEVHCLLTCNSEKTKNDRNAWKSNFLKAHCSFKLHMKHIDMLNNLSKLLITQSNVQFLQMHVYSNQMYREIKKLVKCEFDVKHLN